MEAQFDLIVIGAGTGGTGVARMAAGAGLKTAIVDTLPYGGTCALRGCDPKKMLIGVTEGIEWAANMAGNGLRAEGIAADWPAMMRFKRGFTDAMPARVESGLSRAGITTLHGNARFSGPGTVEIDGRPHRSKVFHIATGARPAPLGFPGEEHLITSTDYLELGTLPRRIAFVGGGFIAMEFAHISRRAGAASVTVLQRRERPLKNFDPDMVDILMRATADIGVDLRCNAAVSAVERNGDGSLSVKFDTPGGPRTVTCDIAVHAGGRVPDIAALNLGAIGVDHGRRGISVTKYMRSTSNADVFAAGDCADSGPNLTPVSANEARIAGKNIVAGKDVRAVRYPPIPSVVFTLPPVASVGLSQADATARGLDFEVHTATTDDWYSSRRVGAKHSGYKTLISRGDGTVLGAHLVGPGAEEQINVIATAMAAGLSANRIKALIFAYPSYSSDIGSML